MSEYIKKEDLFERTINRNSVWNTITDSSGWGLEEIVNDLPTYSFPDSAENKRDLISRGEVESVLHNNLHALIDTDQLYQLYKDINRLPTYSFPDSADDNTMDIYSDLLRVKHGTMSIDSLIDKVWCGRKAVKI